MISIARRASGTGSSTHCFSARLPVELIGTTSSPDGKKFPPQMSEYYFLRRDMFYDYSEYQKLINRKIQVHERFFAYFDGASKGNPGKVRSAHQRGVGFCFFNEKGACVAEFAINAFTGTNNSAEYYGLLYALWTARLGGSIC